jgi:hypothetical protein
MYKVEQKIGSQQMMWWMEDILPSLENVERSSALKAALADLIGHPVGAIEQAEMGSG